MRLFYAVNFTDQVKKKLVDIQNQLRHHTDRGSFTLPENLHLTLAFIGEVAPDKSGSLRQIAEGFHVAPFDIVISGVGRFRRDGGDILWAGIEDNKSLQDLYNKLAAQIRAAGFDLEKRKYTPHLTLARRAHLAPSFDLSAFANTLAPITTQVTKVSLMNSERINGRLTYTALGLLNERS